MTQSATLHYSTTQHAFSHEQHKFYVLPLVTLVLAADYQHAYAFLHDRRSIIYQQRRPAVALTVTFRQLLRI